MLRRTHIAALLTALSIVADGEFCFRKHERHTGDAAESLCRGLMARNFITRKGCCKNGGAGYAIALIPTGEKGKRYSCMACSSMATRVSSSAAGQTGQVSIKPARPPARVVVLPARLNEPLVGWSNWGNWSSCSKSCGVGFQRRERLCLSQVKTCVGEQHEVQACTILPDCPVDGKWSMWQPWNVCSASCSGGLTVRVRQCSSPSAQHGGKPCVGEAREEKMCNMRPCPVNGGWGEWMDASACSATCGKGNRQKMRRCDSPAPQHGGKLCDGVAILTEDCFQQHCPIDGGLSLWTSWGDCSTTCGSGVRDRTRGCDAPRPKHGGANCTAALMETMPCHNLRLCPVNGGWSEFSIYTSCHARPCSGEVGEQRRTRSCSNPQPRFGGQQCEGEHIETRPCHNNESCRVDGGWCEWTVWGQCLAYQPANQMMKMRTRSCNCPAPVHGGNSCSGIDFEVLSCHVMDSMAQTRAEGSGDTSTISSSLQQQSPCAPGGSGTAGGENDEDIC